MTRYPGRVIKSILTTDSRSDKEDSERESHVESTITTSRKKKRTAGTMAVHDIRNHSKMNKYVQWSSKKGPTILAK